MDFVRYLHKSSNLNEFYSLLYEKNILDDFKNYFDALPIYIKNDLDFRKEIVIYNLICSLKKCESPIEQLFAYELDKVNLFQWNVFNLDIEIILIESQFNLKIKNFNSMDKETINYRVDFLIQAAFKQKQKVKTFVIECDGHNFHEKTKEQAKNDKKRDRNLTAAGYVVIRFTGSEIFKNPYKCVREVMNVIINYSK